MGQQRPSDLFEGRHGCQAAGFAVGILTAALISRLYFRIIICLAGFHFSGHGCTLTATA